MIIDFTYILYTFLAPKFLNAFIILSHLGIDNVKHVWGGSIYTKELVNQPNQVKK